MQAGFKFVRSFDEGVGKVAIIIIIIIIMVDKVANGTIMITITITITKVANGTFAFLNSEAALR